MKILQVIHGYPMRYNAGSEVYTQTLSHGLASRHEVQVFTREEDSFAPDFRMRMEVDPDNPRVIVHLVNNPRNRDRYSVDGIDQRFAELLDQFVPDIIHIGHLNHLSTSLVQEANKRSIPVVYTLHDYWIMCPRGQFMQMQPADETKIWAACDGQEDRKCAEVCYARYFGGVRSELDVDRAYWTNWVRTRMQHIREMVDLVDVFIAPAKYLFQRYRDEFGLPESKLRYLDYGFDLKRFQDRNRSHEADFVFGYIGTHIPAKGIHQLIEAFSNVTGNVRLRIWGRPRGQDTDSLRAMASTLPPSVASRIEWFNEYRNQEIVQDVFNHVDAIVVPSIWVENSPLVIHEAQQAKVPVITADVGGMAEYVQHEFNGLLYTHRSSIALTRQMQRFVDNPEFSKVLGAQGYAYSESGDIPSIEQHVREIENLYQQTLKRRDMSRIQKLDGPWRITFDTNPDLCNLKCIMCEEHSPHSELQNIRIKEDRPRREMPIELIRKTIEEAVPHGLREIIPSTMGEPLLYPHFEEILSLCKEFSLKLNLTTNGTFPRLGAASWAKKIVPVTTDIKISWNGATRSTHEKIMLGSSWEKVLKNVRTLIALRDEHAMNGGERCRVTFQLTFLESNIDELADIVRLAISLGVDRVKGHHLWDHFDEIKAESMRRSPDSRARWNAAVLRVRDIVAREPLKNGQKILLENFNLFDDNNNHTLGQIGTCPFLGNEAWVSAVGRFDPCCAPDAQRRTLGEFGSIHAASFMQIWNSEEYDGLVKSYRNRPLCMNCTLRKPVPEAE